MLDGIAKPVSRAGRETLSTTTTERGVFAPLLLTECAEVDDGLVALCAAEHLGRRGVLQPELRVGPDGRDRACGRALLRAPPRDA